LIGKRIFEIGEKYYFENMGVRNIVIGYRITDKGKILENLVYNHLLYKGYNVRIGYYGEKEIDFIGEKNNERVYIQVALKIDSKQTAEKEFGNLLKVQDNYPKIVITEDTFEGNTYEGIKQYSIRDFLMNF
jgi:predicted AAA+ superfamily ATPase